jgi:hypothetical protein
MNIEVQGVNFKKRIVRMITTIIKIPHTKSTPAQRDSHDELTSSSIALPTK